MPLDSFITAKLMYNYAVCKGVEAANDQLKRD